MPLPNDAWCLLIGDNSTLSVDIDQTCTQKVDHLMFATKARIAPPLDTIPTPNLTFYRITIDGPHDKTKRISELN